jgi:hypothetical protein
MSLAQSDMLDRAKGVGWTRLGDQVAPHTEEHRAWLRSIGRISLLDWMEEHGNKLAPRLNDRREGMREVIGEEI